MEFIILILVGAIVMFIVAYCDKKRIEDEEFREYMDKSYEEYVKNNPEKPILEEDEEDDDKDVTVEYWMMDRALQSRNKVKPFSRNGKRWS